MAQKFAPRSFFRKASNADLKHYFHEQGLLEDFDFDGMSETKIQPLYVRWLELSDEVRSKTDLDFQEIHSLVCESGIKAILTESRWPEHRRKYPEDKNLGEQLGNMQSHHDRVFWIFRNRQKYWKGALYCHKVDLIRDNGWRKIKNLPRQSKPPDDDDIRIAAMEKAIGTYYHHKDGRGKNCKVEIYRWEDEDCYFCYSEDYPKASIEFRGDKFIRRRHNPAFEVIFRHNPEKGTLETNARGGRKVVQDLQKLFAQYILSIDDLQIDKTSERVYDMDFFKNPVFRYDPESGIIDVMMKKMEILPHNGSDDRIAVTSGMKKGQHSLQKSLQTILAGLRQENNGRPVPYSILQATIQVKFAMPGGKKSRPKTFHIGWPNRCSLQHDKHDMIIKQMLELSGVEPIDPDLLTNKPEVA